MKTYRIARASIFALAPLFLSACASLEQAPLIYISKQTWGFEGKGGTPEQPGFSLNVGYTSRDAAFVPVVVGADGATSDELRVVTGHYGESEYEPEDRERLDRAKERLASAREDKSTTDKKLEELNSAEAELDFLSGQLTNIQRDIDQTVAAIERLESEKDRAPDADALAKAAAAIVEAQAQLDSYRVSKKSIDARSADLRLVTARLSPSRSGLETRSRQLADEIKSRSDEIASIEREKPRAGDEKKEDALSVYGTFGGEGGASDEGATFLVGKTFSTGVASQNITEGVKLASRLTAVARCLEALNKLHGSVQDSAKIDSSVCRP